MWDYPRDIYLNVVASFSNPKKSVRQTIPYFSQWESPQLVDAILSRTVLASQDPLWKNSGAQTSEEYELWSWNICGMASLKMILTSIYKKEFHTIELAKDCATYGGYLLEQRKGSDILVYCINHIASVHPSIRDPNNITPTYKGGHLIVVTGYDEEKKVLYVHNPSGLYKKSQQNCEISETDFKRFFAGKGIVIYNAA